MMKMNDQLQDFKKDYSKNFLDIRKENNKIRT